MPRAHLTKRYMFAASHRLHCASLSDAENRATYGKCNNPHGHGHNYYVEVTVSGTVDKRTGMVCNLVDLDDCVRECIIERFDHQDLNRTPEFREIVPTSENLCEIIYNILSREFRVAHIERVKLHETRMNSIEFAGAAEMPR